MTNMALIFAFQNVFHSFLGHSISGPPVNTIVYPSQCCHYGVEDKKPNQKIVSDFHEFAARVILTEINRLLKDPPAIQITKADNNYETCEIRSKLPLQPRDIAIIRDSSEHPRLDLVLIKRLLEKNENFDLCSVKEHQCGRNAVPICYYCDIASLEWPVVIHVRLIK